MDILSEKDNIILIDLSYFIFYRYFALIQWWKLAKPEENLNNPAENLEFIEKFKKTFIDKLKEIPKKLKLKNYIIIGGKDCPRKEIWRNSLFNNYKEQREQDDTFMGGYFFNLAYTELIPTLFPFLELDSLEADDCIALFAKGIQEKFSDKKITIIANDMDYLQLADESCSIINLKYKNLQTSKNSTGNKDCDLFCKVVLGDKSDNIPGIFKKCSQKTAIKYFENKDLFNKMVEKEDCEEMWERNKKIIDFNKIPINLQKKFNDKYLIGI